MDEKYKDLYDYLNENNLNKTNNSYEKFEGDLEKSQKLRDALYRNLKEAGRDDLAGKLKGSVQAPQAQSQEPMWYEQNPTPINEENTDSELDPPSSDSQSTGLPTRDWESFTFPKDFFKKEAVQAIEIFDTTFKSINENIEVVRTTTSDLITGNDPADEDYGKGFYGTDSVVLRFKKEDGTTITSDLIPLDIWSSDVDDKGLAASKALENFISQVPRTEESADNSEELMKTYKDFIITTVPEAKMESIKSTISDPDLFKPEVKITSTRRGKGQIKTVGPQPYAAELNQAKQLVKRNYSNLDEEGKQSKIEEIARAMIYDRLVFEETSKVEERLFKKNPELAKKVAAGALILNDINGDMDYLNTIKLNQTLTDSKNMKEFEETLKTIYNSGQYTTENIKFLADKAKEMRLEVDLNDTTPVKLANGTTVPKFLFNTVRDIHERLSWNLSQANILQNEITETGLDDLQLNATLGTMGKVYDLKEKTAVTLATGSLDLLKNIGYVGVKGVGLFNETVDDWADDVMMGEWSLALNDIRDSYERDIALDEITVGNFLQFGLQEITNQAPILALMVATGGMGSVLIGVSSMGESLAELEKLGKISGNNDRVGNWARAALYGTAEWGIAALPTQRLLGKLGKRISGTGATARTQSEMINEWIRKRALNDVLIDPLKEGGEEFVTTVIQNNIMGRSNQFENAGHAFVSGMLVSGAMTNSTALYSHFARNFASSQTFDNVVRLQGEIKALATDIDSGTLKPSEVKMKRKAIEELQGEINSTIIESEGSIAASMTTGGFKLVAHAHEGMAKLTEEIKELRNKKNKTKADKALLEMKHKRFEIFAAKKKRALDNKNNQQAYKNDFDAQEESKKQEQRDKAKAILAKGGKDTNSIPETLIEQQTYDVYLTETIKAQNALVMENNDNNVLEGNRLNLTEFDTQSDAIEFVNANTKSTLKDDATDAEKAANDSKIFTEELAKEAIAGIKKGNDGFADRAGNFQLAIVENQVANQKKHTLTHEGGHQAIWSLFKNTYSNKDKKGLGSKAMVSLANTLVKQTKKNDKGFYKAWIESGKYDVRVDGKVSAEELISTFLEVAAERKLDPSHGAGQAGGYVFAALGHLNKRLGIPNNGQDIVHMMRTMGEKISNGTFKMEEFQSSEALNLLPKSTAQELAKDREAPQSGVVMSAKTNMEGMFNDFVIKRMNPERAKKGLRPLPEGFVPKPEKKATLLKQWVSRAMSTTKKGGMPQGLMDTALVQEMMPYIVSQANRIWTGLHEMNREGYDLNTWQEFVATELVTMIQQEYLKPNKDGEIQFQELDKFVRNRGYFRVYELARKTFKQTDATQNIDDAKGITSSDASVDESIDERDAEITQIEQEKANKTTITSQLMMFDTENKLVAMPLSVINTIKDQVKKTWAVTKWKNEIGSKKFTVELNKEYAKSSGLMFRALMERGLDYDNDKKIKLKDKKANYVSFLTANFDAIFDQMDIETLTTKYPFMVKQKMNEDGTPYRMTAQDTKDYNDRIDRGEFKGAKITNEYAGNHMYSKIDKAEAKREFLKYFEAADETTNKRNARKLSLADTMAQEASKDAQVEVLKEEGYLPEAEIIELNRAVGRGTISFSQSIVEGDAKEQVDRILSQTPFWNKLLNYVFQQEVRVNVATILNLSDEGLENKDWASQVSEAKTKIEQSVEAAYKSEDFKGVTDKQLKELMKNTSTYLLDKIFGSIGMPTVAVKLTNKGSLLNEALAKLNQEGLSEDQKKEFTKAVEDARKEVKESAKAKSIKVMKGAITSTKAKYRGKSAEEISEDIEKEIGSDLPLSMKHGLYNIINTKDMIWTTNFSNLNIREGGSSNKAINQNITTGQLHTARTTIHNVLHNDIKEAIKSEGNSKKKVEDLIYTFYTMFGGVAQRNNKMGRKGTFNNESKQVVEEDIRSNEAVYAIYASLEHAQQSIKEDFGAVAKELGIDLDELLMDLSQDANNPVRGYNVMRYVKGVMSKANKLDEKGRKVMHTDILSNPLKAFLAKLVKNVGTVEDVKKLMRGPNEAALKRQKVITNTMWGLAKARAEGSITVDEFAVAIRTFKSGGLVDIIRMAAPLKYAVFQKGGIAKTANSTLEHNIPANEIFNEILEVVYDKDYSENKSLFTKKMEEIFADYNTSLMPSTMADQINRLQSKTGISVTMDLNIPKSLQRIFSFTTLGKRNILPITDLMASDTETKIYGQEWTDAGATIGLIEDSREAVSKIFETATEIKAVKDDIKATEVLGRDVKTYHIEVKEGRKTFFRGFMKGKNNVVIDANTIVKGKDALEKLGVTEHSMFELELDENGKLNPISAKILAKEGVGTVAFSGKAVEVDPNANERFNPVVFTDNLDLELNKMIERQTGISKDAIYSKASAIRGGAKANKGNIYVPPNAEDFRGLTQYMFAGKGKQGEADQKFFEEKLMDPYLRGVALVDNAKEAMKVGYKALLKDTRMKGTLSKFVPGTDYTVGNAVRVALWKVAGHDIPGLNPEDGDMLFKYVFENEHIAQFANGLISLTQNAEWIPPKDYWPVENVLSDLHNITEKVNRGIFLEEFDTNIEAMFTDENMNKIQALYGDNVKEAIEDAIERMRFGTNRSNRTRDYEKAWMNWTNNSIGAIMFFNRRSAILQLTSATNFINWGDNNILAAGKAFANQKQYWKDFAFLFNSDKLRQRRANLKSDVSEAEIADAAARTDDKAKAVLAYILKLGFTPTQMADSFAIASGGAAFYRNRANKYVKEGLSKIEAEDKAFEDFSKLTEEAQQSGDPSMVSQVQTSPVGRAVMAFQNTPLQYARLMKKAYQDLKNGRGDAKTHISKIIYYGAAQNILFSYLQSGMFALIDGFSDDEEEETKRKKMIESKVGRAANSMVDTVLRGTGMYGAVLATLKNTYLTYVKEDAKGYMANHAYTILSALNIAPAIGSKARKLYGATQTKRFDKKVIDERGWDIVDDKGNLNLSPMYSVTGSLVEATTNFPLERMVNEINTAAEVLDARNSTLQRVALALGWRTWDVGVTNEEHDAIKDKKKKRRIRTAEEKEASRKKAAATREKNRAIEEAAYKKEMKEAKSIKEQLKIMKKYGR